MRRNFFIASLIMLLVSGWIFLGYVSPGKTKEKKFEDSTNTNKIQTVRILTSKAVKRVKKVNLVGNTKPFREVHIKAEISGRVEKILVREGNAVKKGQAIIKIEKRNRSAKLNEIKARVEEKEITYESALRLSASGLQSKSRLAKAKSELEEAKAALIEAEIDLDSTVIKAPFDGILEKVEVEIGDYIQSGMNGGGGGNNNTVAKIIDNKPFIVQVGVSERVVNNLVLGSKAEVELVTGQKVDGKITYISKVANTETRTFDTEITVYDDSINADMGVTASVFMPMKEETAHKIPSSSLALNEKGNFGIKVLENTEKISDGEFKGKVKFYEATVYDSEDGNIWMSNLNEEIKIITLGASFVSEGSIAIGKTK